MTTVVTGLAATLSLDSKQYLAGLNAAAIATQQAQSKMMRAYAGAAAAAQQASTQTVAAIERQAVASRGASQSFLQLGRQVTAVANSWRTLGSLFAIGLIAQGIKAVASYSDAWQTAGNKIAAAAEISGQSARSLSELNKIAANARSPIEDIGDLYSKLIRTTAGVAKSELEVAQATDTVAKAFKAGGASTLEQVNGIRQLAQALGSGILQGDELRSIRENAPLLAKAIADELGTTVAGLKEIGAQGKITADIIFKAILQSKGDIDRAFEATAPTIADANTQISNSFEELVGSINRASGASGKYYTLTKFLSDGFREMAENIAPVEDALKELAAVGIQAVHALGPMPQAIEDITVKSSTGVETLLTYAGALKGIMDATSGFQTEDPSKIFTFGMADKPHGLGLYGPEQSLDFEGIAKRAQEALSAVDKLKSTQHDWATSVEVTEQGKLQIEAFKNLKQYIEDTETPLEKYKQAMAEIALLQQRHYLTSTQAFRASVQQTAQFVGIYLDAVGQATGALAGAFKENKAIQIANAVVNTAAAIVKALGDPKLPFPLDLAVAASYAAAGAAQIAAIAAAQPGSAKAPSVKGGAKSATVASSSDTSAAGASSKRGPSQAVNITIQGESGFSAQQVRELIGHINEAVGDGVHLRVN